MFRTPDQQDNVLRILHVLRAPLGGLFRHVLDLTREQIARGHAVGLITDSSTGGDHAAAVLRDLEPSLRLGLSRIPIRRNPHVSDLAALIHTVRRIRDTRPHVIHGHGSKGAVMARLPGFLPGFKPSVRVYTPHGGSLNHRPGTRIHQVYMAVERLLRSRTDLALFESGFIASRYQAYVGTPALAKVVHNGIGEAEFVPVRPADDATAFVYVGELRAAKGIDLLLAALARVSRDTGTAPDLILVGSGPDRAELEAQAAELGIAGQIAFHGPMSAREAFRLGRVLIVPSRAESLPYVVLEAAGACVPMVATNVGGIPEIFGPFRNRLISSGSVPDLADALLDTLARDEMSLRMDAEALALSVRERFSTGRMVDGVLGAYREALLLKPRPARLPARPSVAFPR